MGEGPSRRIDAALAATVEWPVQAFLVSSSVQVLAVDGVRLPVLVPYAHKAKGKRVTHHCRVRVLRATTRYNRPAACVAFRRPIRPRGLGAWLCVGFKPVIALPAESVPPVQAPAALWRGGGGHCAWRSLGAAVASLACSRGIIGSTAWAIRTGPGCPATPADSAPRGTDSTSRAHRRCPYCVSYNRIIAKLQPYDFAGHACRRRI